MIDTLLLLWTIGVVVPATLLLLVITAQSALAMLRRRTAGTGAAVEA